MVKNRKLVLRDKLDRLMKSHHPSFFGAAFPILATKSTTGRELYEQVWMRVRSMLKLTSHERSQLWWNNCTIANEIKKMQALKPFVLKHVDAKGQACSICHWSEKCFGCLVQPSDTDATQLRAKLATGTFIACEWDQKYFDSNSDPLSMNWQEHESIIEVQNELNQEVPLQDCMKLFQKGDSIQASCSNCGYESDNEKSLKLQGNPPVLMIQLKRFKVTRYQTLKMQSLITFPLYDFDLGEHVAFKEAGKSYMYDLYGIVNHYGTMSFGHYIGFVKNEHTGEWLKYNDSRVTPITEDQV
jgi:hypothetical protein